MSTIVMGFADTLMVGRYGTDELAAAGFVNNILGLLIVGGMGFSYGITPVVGALLGEGRTHAIAGKLRNGLFACTAVGLLLMLLAALLLLSLPLLGQPEELLPLMRSYLFVLLLSLLPQMVFNAYKQFSDGIKDTATPMWIMLIANVLNVVGNWALIFGHLGLPELGLLGAGISTLLSRLVQLLLMAGVFHLSKHYELYRRDFPKSSLAKADLRELYRLGVPVALQLGMEAASFSFSVLYVGWLGAAALAAHQIVIIISQFFFMLYYGLSAAVAVQVSYFRGAGELEDQPFRLGAESLAGGDVDVQAGFRAAVDEMAFGLVFLHGAAADERRAEVFRFRVFDGVRHGDGFGRPVENKRADERFELGHVVGGRHVHDDGVLLIGVIRLEDDALRASACPLQFACDDRHAMAEGIQQAECVTLLSK